MNQKTAEALPLDSAFLQQPHDIEALLRDEAPVRQVTSPQGLRLWLVTRHEDVKAVLTDSRVRKNVAGATELMTGQLGTEAAAVSPAFRYLSSHMLYQDPPDHKRLRRLVGKAFTTQTVARLRPRIEQVTDELLDAMAGPDPVDLLRAFAEPLPMTVICELLGIPESERRNFRAWSTMMVSQVSDERFATAAVEFKEYLADLVTRRRAAPGDDLLSELVVVSDGGDQLTDQELISTAFLLVIAGHDTTVNLIGNGMLALLDEPEQLAALRADPGLLPGAIEELLRYDGPVHIATQRYTVAPITIGGVDIPAGEFVAVSLSAANRDEQRFPDPGKLDVTRPVAGHVAFGYGIHHCLGAPLARLEALVALGALITRFPKLRLAVDRAELTWRFSLLIRGVEELPVHLG